MYNLAVQETNPPTLTGGLACSRYVVTGWGGHIDYITATCEDSRGEERWVDQKVLQDLVELYNTERMKPWTMRDYNGYSIGKVAWGERLTGTIRQVTSSAAQLYVNSVGAIPVAPRSTRLDITIDVTFANDTQYYVSRCATERPLNGVVRKSGKPLLITSYGDGDTFYVGAASSAKRLRIYDKYKESGGEEQYERTIRYELQLRSPHSERFFDFARHNPDCERTILSTVKDHCERVYTFFPNIDTSMDAVPLRVPKVDKTVERQLEWLNIQVCPTVRRLIGAGHKERVLRALGLTDDVE